MFNYLKEKYESGFLTINNLRKAVVKGWLTAEEFKEITKVDYIV